MDPHREQRARFTVLVVEDDAMVREVSVGLLKMLGYRTLAAPDGESALALLGNADPVHVLFTDVVMPGGMSGFQLAEAARRQRPGLKVVFASGYSAANLAPTSGKPPSARILHKPFQARELCAAMEEALRGD